MRRIAIGILAILSCTLATAQTPPLRAAARLRLILVDKNDATPLTVDRLEQLYRIYPHHEQILTPGKRTNVVLNTDFHLSLLSWTEFPESTSRVLFWFEWDRVKGDAATLTRAGAKYVPALNESRNVAGMKQWWVADHALAADPRRGLSWRLQLNKNSFYDFSIVAPAGE